MSKTLKTIIFLSSLISLVSCKNNESQYKNILFFSEFYSGNSINDCVLELGTSSSKDFSLDGFKVNFYTGKEEISYTYTFTDEIINTSKLVLFVNNDFEYTNDISTIIKLDDNYICGRYYVELVDKDGFIVDSLGQKGFNLEYLSDGSLIRLNEYHQGYEIFNNTHFIKYRPNYLDNLGILNCPISLEEVLNGPVLETELYSDLPFSKNNTATNGFCEVTVNSLGDGDTTYFNFPSGSGIENDYNNRVRYLLINTPEIDHGPGSDIVEEPYGQEAKKFNNDRLNKATLIVVQSSKDAGLKDTYSRTLGFVWYTTKENPSYSDLKLLNHELLINGLARYGSDDYPSLYSKDILYQDYMNYALNYAIDNKLNIYS